MSRVTLLSGINISFEKVVFPLVFYPEKSYIPRDEKNISFLYKNSFKKQEFIVRILFQGDSITDGNRGRTEDPNHLYGHGYVFSIVSTLSAAYPDHTFFNRGNSGDTVADLLKRWNKDTLALEPDVVSILVGTNDAIKGNITPQRFETIYRMLLEDLPDAKFILCEPFRFKGNMTDEDWAIRSECLRGYQTAIRNLAAETNAVFVPLQDVFDEACKRAEPTHWIWDGIHPTAAGHHLLAQRFLECTQEIWK